jgi:hypothetical protein
MKHVYLLGAILVLVFIKGMRVLGRLVPRF